MITTHLSTKGQVVIPQSICRSHRWKPGLEFTIEESGAALILRPHKPFPETTFEQAFGVLKHKGRKVSIKRMGHALKIGARKSNDCN